MRAAAILGLGCSPHDLRPFQGDKGIKWEMGVPASAREADAILLFGGDGTIHRHLGQLVRLGLPVLIVPAGSGNDFARALGLLRVRDSLSAWERFCKGEKNIRAIDLGTITPLDRSDAGEAPALHSTRYFSCVAGVGLDGEVSRRANQWPRWLRGHGGYALSLLPTIFQFKPVPLKIFTDGLRPASGEAQAAELPSVGQSLRPGSGQAGAAVPAGAWTLHSDRPMLLAAFANTPVYGGGMKVAPKAKMDDGLLDICVVGAVDPVKLFVLFPTVYAGRHLGIREVDYFQAERARVETEHALDVYADGEYVCATPIEVSVHRKAIHLITPAAPVAERV